MTITIADGRGALWQWDTGRRVKITDGDGVKQIHYQNRALGGSVDVDVGADGTAIIPDELLQDWHPLTAYAYVTDDTGAYTMVQQDFVVHKRGKPADYVYTPTDQMTLQMIQRQIGDLADLTTEAKENLVAAINEVARMGGRMSLRVAGGYIQYSTDSGSTWTNLIAVADLKGADGKPGAAGQDGHSPVVAATKFGKTTIISVDGTDIAAVEDGADGKPGVAGANGITPTIGANGNWYLGTTDTNKPSRGAKGDKGDPGEKGDPGAPGKDGAGMDITGATVGQIAKITAVDASGVPTAWEPVDMPSGGGGGEAWELVAEATTTDIVNSLRVTFDACNAVFVEFYWGGVENDLGDIAVYPNQGDTPYVSENRAAAAKVKSSTTAKRGMLWVRMDCRVGSYWTAVSNQKYRGDGAFNSIDANNLMNMDIGLDSHDQYSVINSGYMTTRDDTPASGVKSITAYGAGMAIGTRIKVWGIKK